MINVLIKIEGKEFQSLEVRGHADSAPNGKDLVCAAVSAVVTGGANALKEPQNFHIEFKEGLFLLEKKYSISSHDEIVIETIITGLRTIAEDNHKFIKIKNL